MLATWFYVKLFWMNSFTLESVISQYAVFCLLYLLLFCFCFLSTCALRKFCLPPQGFLLKSFLAPRLSLAFTFKQVCVRCFSPSVNLALILISWKMVYLVLVDG
ncbi:hypothetical protein L1887_36090 [Cichorium endivia]|nr:hypothetical protein L1887_36090 [Cichorium endivia]